VCTYITIIRGHQRKAAGAGAVNPAAFFLSLPLEGVGGGMLPRMLFDKTKGDVGVYTSEEKG